MITKQEQEEEPLQGQVSAINMNIGPAAVMGACIGCNNADPDPGSASASLHTELHADPDPEG